MNAADIIAALALPASSHVERRVPKKLLLEHGAPTAADKRQINDGIEELFWVASLKPTTIGVAEYRDNVCEYLEIAVLQFTLRDEAKAARLVELVHRAVPYPMLLLTEHAGQMIFSAAHKRWAQNEAEKTVLDGDVVAADWGIGSEIPYLTNFLYALALARQPHSTLRTLYQGWMDTLIAFNASRLTGSFKMTANPEQAAARQESLRECTRLETEMTRLRAAAKKEKQMSRKVELNMELKRVEAAFASARARL